jgi:hypothetical protein
MSAAHPSLEYITPNHLNPTEIDILQSNSQTPPALQPNPLPLFITMPSNRLPSKIGIILFPGFQLLDATGPLDAFNLLSNQHTLQRSTGS